jgi:hypothetical protein
MFEPTENGHTETWIEYFDQKACLKCLFSKSAGRSLLTPFLKKLNNEWMYTGVGRRQKKERETKKVS